MRTRRSLAGAAAEETPPEKKPARRLRRSVQEAVERLPVDALLTPSPAEEEEAQPAPPPPPPPAVATTIPEVARGPGERASFVPIKKYSEKIDVQLNVQIFRVRKIDNSSEEITLDLGITFMWTDPHLVQFTEGYRNFSTHPSISRFKENATMKHPQLWPDDLQVGYGAFDPAWKIENCSTMEIIKFICMIIDPSIGLVHNYIHLVATVHHAMDMKLFPFDCQQIAIKIRSEHADKVMQFVPFEPKREAKIFYNETSEWTILRPLKLEFNNDTVIAASGILHICIAFIRLLLTMCADEGIKYVSAEFTFGALRKPQWYLYNVLLTSALIVLASFSMFFIPEENVAERLGLVFTYVNTSHFCFLLMIYL
jgi:hypothetical protein